MKPALVKLFIAILVSASILQSQTSFVVTGRVMNQSSATLDGVAVRVFMKNISGSTVLIDTTRNGGTFKVTTTVSAISSPGNSIPKEYELSNNYPNPFNPATDINFSLPRQSKVTLVIYDLLGKEVATILHGDQIDPGDHTVRINLDGLANGFYVARATFASEETQITKTQKLLLLYGSQHAKGYIPRAPSQQILFTAAIRGIDSIQVAGGSDIAAATFNNLPTTATGVLDVGTLQVNQISTLIIGPVYDVFTKYVGKVAVRATAKLSSDPSKITQTDANGMIVIKTWHTGRDSLTIIPADTTYAKYGNGRLDIAAGDNAIKAFHDTTGIPLFVADDSLLSYVENIGGSEGVESMDYTLFGIPEFNQTIPRLRDEDLPLKIWMGRINDPTGGWYADSVWAGFNRLADSVNGKIGFKKIKFFEVSDSASAFLRVRYSSLREAEAQRALMDHDERGPYLSYWIINFRGAYGLSDIEVRRKYMPFTAAHEMARVFICAFSRTSPNMNDILFGDVITRYDDGIRTYASGKEARAFAINFLLETNPKWLDYFK